MHLIHPNKIATYSNTCNCSSGTLKRAWFRDYSTRSQLYIYIHTLIYIYIYITFIYILNNKAKDLWLWLLWGCGGFGSLSRLATVFIAFPATISWFGSKGTRNKVSADFLNLWAYQWAHRDSYNPMIVVTIWSICYKYVHACVYNIYI